MANCEFFAVECWVGIQMKNWRFIHSFWFSNLQTQNARTRCWSTLLPFKCLWSGAKTFQSGRVNFEDWSSNFEFWLVGKHVFVRRVDRQLQATVQHISQHKGQLSSKTSWWSTADVTCTKRDCEQAKKLKLMLCGNLIANGHKQSCIMGENTSPRTIPWNKQLTDLVRSTQSP